MNGDVHAEPEAALAAGSEEREARVRRRSEANQHVVNYVNDRLERVRSNESIAVYEDEFEAHLDDN